MGLWAYIRRLLRSLFGRDSDDPDVYVPPDRAHSALESNSGEGRPIEVALYETDSLAETRGGAPERMLARQIAHVLDEFDFNYHIEYGFVETYDPPTDEGGTNLELFQWWVDTSPERARDCNMLLTDARGGGRGGVGGPNSVHGQNRVKHLEDPKSECSSDQCNNLRGGVHEFLHNMGGRHATPMMQEKPSTLPTQKMVDLMREEVGPEPSQGDG